MKFSSLFQEALRQFLATRDVTATRVLDFEEETQRFGMCQTCSYEETVVHISYIDLDGDYSSYEYSGRFADLIRELTGDDE